MTICHLSLVSISAIPCDVRQQDANASLSDITEERKVGQEADEEEEEVVEVDLGRGEHIPQFVQILDSQEGERSIMRVFHPGCIGTAPTCRPHRRMWRIPRVCKNCR